MSVARVSRDVRMVHSENDRAVYDAGSGLRPDTPDAVPVSDEETREFQFAPSYMTYKVAADGSGTHVRIYGSDTHGHSVAVTATDFNAYCYVSLEQLYDAEPSESRRAMIVNQLVEELQASLLMAAALDSRSQRNSWAPERKVFRGNVAGYVRSYKDKRTDTAGTGVRVVLSEPRSSSAQRMPIVHWEIVDGLPLKGHGPRSGYRGTHARNFLKLYFYAPSLVTRARALLHNKWADLGALEQARRVARTGGRDPINVVEEGSAAGGGQAALNQYGGVARNDRAQRTLPRWSRLPDERGDDDTTRHADEAGEWEEAFDAEEEDLVDQEAAEIESENAESDPAERPDDLPAPVQRLTPGDVADDATESDNDEQPSKRRRRTEYETTLYDEREMVQQCEVRLEARFERRALERLRRADEAVGGHRILHRFDEWEVFEADIDFVLRFAIDHEFAPEEWISFQCADEFRVTDERQKKTHCQLEFVVPHQALTRVDDEALQNTPPPHMRVSLDCEMQTGPDMAMPEPETEPMLQTVFVVQDRQARVRDPLLPEAERGKFYYRSVSFVLGGRTECRSERREYCTARHILCFTDERVMYKAMARFVRLVGAQIVSGYNSDGFDLPYLLERAEHLGVGKDFAESWSLAKFGGRMRVRERSFGSKASGNIQFKDVRAEGMITLDLFFFLKKDPMTKLRNYSLGFVASLWVQSTKEDVPYSAINGLQQSAAGRERLRSYCEWDALLPLLIMEKRMIFAALIEMARINGCTLEVLLKRGQQVRSNERKGEGGVVYTHTHTKSESVGRHPAATGWRAPKTAL